jgi:serine protease AprX
MRQQDNSGSHEGIRWSALWGGGPKGRARGALWGGATRGVATLAVFALCLTVGATTAAANNGRGNSSGTTTTTTTTTTTAATGANVQADLLAEAKANPKQMFAIIVQSDNKGHASSVRSWTQQNGSFGRKLDLINGVNAKLPGAAIAMLSQLRQFGRLTITRDVPVSLMGETPTNWQPAVAVDSLWSVLGPLGALLPAPQAPTIAVVDSGIDATRAADFGSRVVARADFVGDGATGDPEGHGTLVAGMAAGSSSAVQGAAPNANLVDVRVAGASGEASMSGVVAGLQWVLDNKDKYNIKVANVSLATNQEASLLYDPLDQAVEKLWLNGVVVVAAAGNNGVDGAPVPLGAPGNDPFIITVGAVDTNGTATQTDDFRAPWSAYGATADGFSKPELTAPGRVMAGPVSTGSFLYSKAPDRQTVPGYMWMSGTSFSSPVVAGIAAQVLARHPGFTPDQVKGALMVTAQGLAGAGTGIGEANASRAAAQTSPPNPNVALDAFVTKVDGVQQFDPAAWQTAASTSNAWTSNAWTSNAWTSNAWTSNAWTSNAWTSNAWTSNAWTSNAWTSNAWTSNGWVR